MKSAFVLLMLIQPLFAETPSPEAMKRAADLAHDRISVLTLKSATFLEAVDAVKKEWEKRRAEWDGETPDATFLYTLTTGFSLSEKLGCYVEVYGFAPQNDTADHRFDGGFTYLISDNFMIDASGGFGITENAPDYYTAFGFSFRL